MRVSHRWRFALVTAALLVPTTTLGIMGARAQTPPAAPPTCDDRLAATAAYADLVKQIRDQLEQRVAELAAKVQALERAAATAATKPAAGK